jgi:hypothetical protein
LNIGDDGTNLFRDLLSQFYAIGPYILNSTYFYQSYYNASLNSAISQLREQLQVVISMGEYFDHAYYGIAHTKEGMRRKIPVLAANPSSKLNYDDKEVPIFIVGNGPSLDSSIEAIKEWQGQVIVVSCGTTLQALHRHGITPDFHAEIEQNRSTYDWAVLIGDLDYLKNITLISCNGIHPDTCDLYKDVMIAFKEGESSTVSALNVLGRKNFETLLNAFPTVSNFAIDLFSTIGFTSIYLIGVDLGFVDVKHHHSKSSGYYQEDGKETYNYADSANTSLIVPGNFRPTVNTKHEFKVSRQVIEQVTSAKPKGQDFYNCSDGAKISGTLPIRPDELLIVATEQQKMQLVEKLKIQIFSTEQLGNYVEKFETHYSHNSLIEELSTFETLLKKEVTSKDDAEKIITKQKEMLFASYKTGKSLLFYYLYGTVNYANATLTKMQDSTKEYASAYTNTNLLVSHWCKTLMEIKKILQNDNWHFDNSEFRKNERESLILSQNLIGKSLLIVTNSTSFANSYQWVVKNQLTFITKLTICSPNKLDKYQMYDYIIYTSVPRNSLALSDLKLGKENTLMISTGHERLPVNLTSEIVTFIIVSKLMQNDDIFINNAIVANITIRACLNVKTGATIIPRINSALDSKTNIPQVYSKYLHLNDFNKAVVFTYYSLLFKSSIPAEYYLSNNGSRGKLVVQVADNNIYVFRKLSREVINEAYKRFDKRIPNLFKKVLFDNYLIYKS